MSTKKESKKGLYRLLSNKIAISIVIVFLFLFWWGASLLFNPETSFTILKHEYNFDKYKAEKVLKGDKISGEFKSPDNYLGIVSINFDRYIKPDYLLEDEIVFRFREKGSRKWQYQQQYRSGYFENLNLFPFGMPIVENSRSKTYEFEIESLKGNDDNALTISSNDPKIVSSHFFPTQIIKQNLAEYLMNKSLNSLGRINFLLFSVIFVLPLIYFSLILLLINKSRSLKEKFALLVLLFILIDIFIVNLEYPGVFFALIGCYLASIKSNRFENTISFSIGFLLIVIWVILTFFGIDSYSAKFNIWAYFFLVIGTVQLLVENKLNLKELKGYDHYLKRMIKFYEKI